jgi:hypothetical protein
LLPQPSYVLVGGDQVLSGAVARRTPTYLPLLGEDGKILVGQLSSPTEDIARGFSVNLLGQFQVEDIGWRPLVATLYTYWQEGEQGLLPQVEEAEYKEPGTWNYYWLDIRDLHGVSFVGAGKQYTCCVCHKPTRCNYWHFELHFHDETGAVVAQMSRGQIDKAARRIRPWLIEQVKTAPPESVPTYGPWKSSLYSSAP